MLDAKGTSEDINSTNSSEGKGEDQIQIKTTFTKPDVEMSFNEDDFPF